jgi:hypothetical protein
MGSRYPRLMPADRQIELSSNLLPRNSRGSRPPSKPEGAERRKAHLQVPRFRPCGLRRGRALFRERSPFGAPPRRFWAAVPCFRDSDGGLFARLIRRLSPPSSCPVQPNKGQPPVVRADGYPQPPGDALARHIRGRRLPRSATKTPPEAPSVSEDEGNIVLDRERCQ